MALGQMILGSKHRNTLKNIEKIFSFRTIEIWFKTWSIVFTKCVHMKVLESKMALFYYVLGLNHRNA